MADSPMIYPPYVGRVINAYVEQACARSVSLATGSAYDPDAHAKAAAEFDRMIGQLNDADDLLTFLDDTFSGGHEIRFCATHEPIRESERTEERDGATIVWVDEPPAVNEFGDSARRHECLSDALRSWAKLSR